VWWCAGLLAAPGVGSADAEVHHVKVYAEPGRFGGWPANHGLWAWGNEVLVGFSAGYYRDLGPDRHHIHRGKPEEHLLARSRDGGETWTIENPAAQGALIPAGTALHGVARPGLKERPWRESPGGIDFSHPDFALTLRMTDVHAGPSRFYYSIDRGHSWEGPFGLPLFGQVGVAARTDYLVDGPQDCLLFLTASKPNGREGRPFCARTTDGGRTWDPEIVLRDDGGGRDVGYPRTVQRPDGKILTVYYFHDRPQSDRYIVATIWHPGQPPGPNR